MYIIVIWPQFVSEHTNGKVSPVSYGLLIACPNAKFGSEMVRDIAKRTKICDHKSKKSQ